MTTYSKHTRFTMKVPASALLALCVACGPVTPPHEINDPYEATNRKIHAFNKRLDFRLKNAAASDGGPIVPPPVAKRIVNISNNLGAPRNALNNFLQGDVAGGVGNIFSFLINSTAGIGGFFDPAGDIGVVNKYADFANTFYIWGLKEGDYVELPFVGGITKRDIVGKGANILLSPWALVDSLPFAAARVSLSIAGRAVQRDQYSKTIDELLYDSTDSYDQLKNYIVSQRRHELSKISGTPIEDDFIDPYAE